MNIMTVSFEEYLNICVDGQIVRMVAFKTPEHGNVKFGLEAPRTLKVHREEIYLAIKEKEKQTIQAGLDGPTGPS